MSRGIVVRGTPKRSLMVFRRVVVTSEWLIRLRSFSLVTRYMFSFFGVFLGLLVLKIGRG